MKKLNLMITCIAIWFLATSGWSLCTVFTNQATLWACPNGQLNPAMSKTGWGAICVNSLHYSYGEQLGVPYCSGNPPSARVDIACCTSQCDTDSISCISQGNIWTNDPSATCGKSCKINHCKAADSTWLSTSIAACTGSNNYALVNTDSTCEHVGTCCSNDSIPSGNTCKWRCDSLLTTCNDRTGELFGGVLPDTSVSGQDTTFSYQCYYNCSHSPNPDSSVYLVEGNIVLGGPSDSIPDGIKSQSTFNSVRTTTGGVYIYDYLSPAASEYIDSIATVKCVEHLWRCVINNKYVYWYDNQEVPAGCTNIVRVK